MNSFLLLLLLLPFSKPDVPADKMTSIPYYTAGPIGTHYSGYVNIPSSSPGGGFKHIHYWLQVSENSPSSDPFLFWTNGGPGCSSMDGAWFEHGMFHFNNSVHNVIKNEWRWTQKATWLFVEQPVGVGFSWSDNENDYKSNDNSTADDNLNFLLAFFKLYPEFTTQDFYLSGESYAGIYIPMLAERVMKTSSLNGRFRGILVGNGVTDYRYDNPEKGLFPMLYFHGFLNDHDYDLLTGPCLHGKEQGCLSAQLHVNTNMRNVDVYDLYSQCYHQRNGSDLTSDFLENIYRENYKLRVAQGRLPSSSSSSSSSRKRNAHDCGDSVDAQGYFNDPVVKQAMHVKSDIWWQMCSDGVKYTKNIRSVIPIYQELMSRGKRILVFSGDVDAAVPYTGTVAWLNSLSWASGGRDWDAWFFTSSINGTQNAGTVTEYMFKQPNGGSSLGIYFVTVRGSGHMVPQFRPEAAWYMFSRWINGQQL